MNRKTKQALARTGYQFTAVILAVILVLVMRSITHGQELPVRNIKTKAEGVKVLNAADNTPAGADITWEILEPSDKLFVARKNGTSIAFWMDEDRRVVVLCDVIDWVGKKRFKTKTIITSDDPVPPDPDPRPPVPPVPPTGFAGDVFSQAKLINKPADCLRLASVFEGLSARIAAGGFSTLEQIGSELTRQNDELNLDASWRTFGSWLSGEMGNRAQSIPQTKEVMDQVAIGLKAAGGK